MKNEAALKLEEICVGQKVKLVCPYLKQVFRDDTGILVGKVTEVFCISEDNYQVDISNSTQRFRWQSNKDGGNIFLAK